MSRHFLTEIAEQIEYVTGPIGARVHVAALAGASEATGQLFYRAACGAHFAARDIGFESAPATCLRCIVIMAGAGS